MPTELMQAAMTAISNRAKANSIDRIKSKGKAPIPPSRNEYDEPMDSVDHVIAKSQTAEMPHTTAITVSKDGSQPDLCKYINFAFGSAVISSSSKILFRTLLPSLDSDAEYSGQNMQQIELNSKHITVHQASEEEEDTNEERRTASLGDLSKLEHGTSASSNRPSNGTLERAQSLEMSDANNQIASGKVTPKKRKAHGGDLVEVTELKEPRFSEPITENHEPMHTVRLKSSYEWGNLEDAIYDGKDKGTGSDDSFELESPQKKLSSSSMDMMSEVLAAADKFDKEINDIELNDVMSEISKVEFDMPTPDAINGTDETIQLESVQDNQVEMKEIAEMPNEIESMALNNGAMPENAGPLVNEEQQQNVTQIQLSTVEHVEVKPIDNFNEIVIDPSKANNYGTNFSDDAKASRYPLGSLDRPKSEVLKQLIAQQVPGESDAEQSMEMEMGIEVEVNGILYPKSANKDGPINISVSGHTENDGEEPKQISPVFSSDGSGVNNISISSTESEMLSASKNSNASPIENRVTISTNDSQPASIVIEDESLNFKMQTLDDEPNELLLSKAPATETQKSNNEVFIVESLSSKKTHETSLPVSNGKELKPPAKGFVTEIRFSNANKDKQMNAKNLSKSMEIRNHSPDAKARNEAKSSSPNNNRKGNEKPTVDEEYIPRNNEIRFTTSTYQSPRQIDKRHSQIDQIRSNFERSHTSEIPIPIRKISTPSTPPPSQSSNVARVSPSKIPVFTSQKSSDNLLKNNNNATRVSVSVTSIKNSSRNPSGK